MLGFQWVTVSSILKPPPIRRQCNNFPCNFMLNSETHHRFPPRFIRFAQNSNHDRTNNITEESNSKSNGKGQDHQKQQEQQQNQNGFVNGDDVEKDRRPVFNLKWGDVFNPDPDNVFAVGLAGLLTWASLQVLWQLLLISLAILVAALKYSFIAALLLFILITLL